MTKSHATRPSRVHFYRTIAFTFLFLTAVAVAVVVYFIFVRAQVVVSVAAEPFRTHFVMDVVPKNKHVLAVEQVAGFVGELAVTDTQSVSATGSKEVQQERAEGVMTVVNNHIAVQPLVATTRFLSPDGLLLRTTESVRVPAGASATVPVYITDEEWRGVLAKNTSFTIPGLREDLQSVIYGTLSEAVTQGVSMVSVVSTEDTVRLERSLQEQLDRKIKSQFVQTYPKSKQEIIRYHLTFEPTIFSMQAGEVAETLTATTTATLVGVQYPYAAFTELRNKKIKETLPDDKVWQQDSSLETDISVENVDLDAGTARLSVSVAMSMISKEDSALFDKKVLTGLTPEEVRSYYETFPQVTSVTVILRPKWLATLPGSAERIDLQVKLVD